MKIYKSIVPVVLFFILFAELSAQSIGVKGVKFDVLARAEHLVENEDFLAAKTLLREEAASGNSKNKLRVDFLRTICDFELRLSDAKTNLIDFSSNYPVNAYTSQVYLMLAVLEFEENNFKKAENLLSKIDPVNFNERDKTNFYYYLGLVSLELNKNQEAIVSFEQIVNVKWELEEETDYYYAYANYKASNFEIASPLFESMSENAKFTDYIPYYQLQIRYQNGDKLVADEALLLLQNNGNNPLNALLFKILGELEYASGNFEKALAWFDKYEKRVQNPHRNVYFTIAMANYDLKKFAHSILYLKKLTSIADKITQKAYLFMGNAYLKVNDKENARMAYEAALELNFDSQVREQALYNYALTSYETNTAFGEAIAGFEQFLFEFPHSAYANDAQNYLATELLSSHNYEMAYESVLKIRNPNNSILATKQYLLYQMGANAFQANQFEKARDLFTQSIQTLSGGTYEAEAFYWRSECFSRLDQNAKSISDLHAFFKLQNSKESSNFIKAHYSMGYAYFSQKSYALAEDWFAKFIEKYTQRRSSIYADALNRQADCLYAQRNFRKAELTYLDAVNASPNTGDYGLFQSAYVSGVLKNYATKISRLSRLVANYPKSEYVDEALYEMGRSYLMLNNESDAIRIYKELIARQPNSSLSRKAAVEIGMGYNNQGNNTEAIAAFKKVIADYPGSDEAYTSLENLESIYIEINQVKTFLDYTKTLNLSMSVKIENREDSISYIAAERQYFNSNYEAAIKGFHAYLQKYCTGGRFCTSSLYYLADSYDKSGQQPTAMQMFKELLKIQGNQFMAVAANRAAEISYENDDFNSASDYYDILFNHAESSEQKWSAQLGKLRASYKLNNTDVVLAAEILADPKLTDEISAEVRFYRAKSYLAKNLPAQALDDLKLLAENTRTEIGAESKYLLARSYFDLNDLQLSEKEIMDFAKKNTPYPYWLARSFVLISDIYISLDNPFQAKQFLLSLRKNYKTQDDIQEMINSRLKNIDANKYEKE